MELRKHTNTIELEQENTILRQQRDEMLAALKEAWNWIDDARNLYPNLEDEEILSKIVFAITNAKGVSDE